MVTYSFGPPPSTFEYLIELAQDNDPGFAQSLYDVQTSGKYGFVDLQGAIEPNDPYEIVAAQHVFWDDEIEALRGQGLALGSSPATQQAVGLAYRSNALNLAPEVNTPETDESIRRSLSVLKAGKLGTFAAWEYVVSPRNAPGSLRLIYPRMLFEDGQPTKLAEAKSFKAIPLSDLDLSMNMALLTSAVAYTNSKP